MDSQKNQNISIKQKQFFERLKQSIPDSVSLVQEISDLLNISLDSGYRRLRGEKLLDFSELEIICYTYGVQPLELVSEKAGNMVAFSYYPHLKTYNDFKAYILKIRDDVTRIKPSKNLSLHISAADLPLFVHFKYAELTKFKFFYWLKSVIGDKAFENQTLDFDLIDEELCQASQEIYEAYVKIPSIEIWSNDTLGSTIKQFLYYWESGSFNNKAQAELILNQISDLLKTVKTMADKNAKQIEGSHINTAEKNYQLYFSDVTIGNNCILLSTESYSEVYLSHYNYKSIKTRDTEFISDTTEWLENLIQKSTLISGIAEKQRFQFFKNLERKVDEMAEVINQ